MIRRPPISTLSPSTTLSRSLAVGQLAQLAHGLLLLLALALGVEGLGQALGQLTAAEERVRRLLVLLVGRAALDALLRRILDRKSTRLNSSHSQISYAVFCLK